MTDGYTAYDELGKQPDITMLGCMAHARRKYFEVAKASKNAKSAQEALSRIKKIYAVEHEARDRKLEAAQIRELRQEKAVPLLESFKKWMDKKVDQVPPKSLLGKAQGESRPEVRCRLIEDRLSSCNAARQVLAAFIPGVA